MQFSVPINVQKDLITIKTSISSSNRLSEIILNAILWLMGCIFIVCFIGFLRQERPVSIILTNIPVSNVVVSDSYINLTRNRGYYDYESYFVNNTLKTENKTRRYYYIDLGCFDGRDMEYFVHFHLEEIARFGTLNIVAFEPDPINLSACKIAQQKLSNLQITVYDTAVWTENGQARYATEKGQKSKIDPNSALYVRSIDFSEWLGDNFGVDDYVYIKFTVEGVEIPILEKMVVDGTLSLVDYMEIEWSDALAAEFEPRRVVLECMFDSFGMDFLYMVNPVDSRHAFNVKDTYAAVPKDKGWYV
jgi:FkbM family methyltransferase